MRRKWNDSRGETLVEILCALLIGTLAVALLCSLAMASVSMDRSARKADKDFGESLSKAEEQKDGGKIDPALLPADSKVTVAYTPPGPASPTIEEKISVQYYGGEGAVSYALGS